MSGIPGGSGRCRIDLLDGGDDEDSGDLALMSNDAQLDDEEREVKQSIAKHRFESVYGIEGDEGQVSADLRKSRSWFSKQSNSKVRASIAGRFLLKRETEVRASTQSKTPEAAKSTAQHYADFASGIFSSDYVPNASGLADSAVANKQDLASKVSAAEQREGPFKKSRTTIEEIEAKADGKAVQLDDIKLELPSNLKGGAAKQPERTLIESGHSEVLAQVEEQKKPEAAKSSQEGSKSGQVQPAPGIDELVLPNNPGGQSTTGKEVAEAPKPIPKEENVKVDNFVSEEQKQGKEKDKERRKKSSRFTSQKPAADDSQTEIPEDLGRAPRPQSVVSTTQLSGHAASFSESRQSIPQGFMASGPIPAH